MKSLEEKNKSMEWTRDSENLYRKMINGKFQYIRVTKFELQFKTSNGFYKNFAKEFSSEKHRDNFIDKVERDYGWKLIGMEPIKN